LCSFDCCRCRFHPVVCVTLLVSWLRCPHLTLFICRYGYPRMTLLLFGCTLLLLRLFLPRFCSVCLRYHLRWTFQPRLRCVYPVTLIYSLLDILNRGCLRLTSIPRLFPRLLHRYVAFISSYFTFVPALFRIRCSAFVVVAIDHVLRCRFISLLFGCVCCVVLVTFDSTFHSHLRSFICRSFPRLRCYICRTLCGRSLFSFIHFTFTRVRCSLRARWSFGATFTFAFTHSPFCSV